MDKYLIAIKELEEKRVLLEDRKKRIIKTNQKKEDQQLEYKKNRKKLESQVKISEKRKNYLENKKYYKKKFFKKAILFGIKSASFFFASILGILFVVMHSVSISVATLCFHFLWIGSILGLVEFRYVSKEFFELTKDITLEEANSLLEQLLEKLEDIKKKQLESKEEVRENKILLEEIEEMLQTIEEQVTFIRTSRNQLIEELIGNLDFYIPNFKAPQIDIQKLMEKKFKP